MQYLSAVVGNIYRWHSSQGTVHRETGQPLPHRKQLNTRKSTYKHVLVSAYDPQLNKLTPTATCAKRKPDRCAGYLPFNKQPRAAMPSLGDAACTPARTYCMHASTCPAPLQISAASIGPLAYAQVQSPAVVMTAAALPMKTRMSV